MVKFFGSKARKTLTVIVLLLALVFNTGEPVMCLEYETGTEETVESAVEASAVEAVDAVEMVSLEPAIVAESRKYFEEIGLSKEWQDFTYDVCEAKGVPVELVFAIAEQESGFNPEAVSQDGQDIGLFQIRKLNHEWISGLAGKELDFTDAYDSVLGVVEMLGQLLETNNGDLTKALMCYNMGPTGAKRAWENGVYETEYTKKTEARVKEWRDKMQ